MITININMILILKWYSVILMAIAFILANIDYIEKKDNFSLVLTILLFMPVLIYLIIR